MEEHERVMDELRRVLRPGGTLLISSPNRDVYALGNLHHVHEFLPDELRDALARRFDHVVLHGQHVVLASAIVGGEGLPAARPDRFRGFTTRGWSRAGRPTSSRWPATRRRRRRMT